MIHLDTTFLVDLLREGRKGLGPAMSFLDTIEKQDLAISVHALCELQAGAELASDPRREKEAIQRICSALWVRSPDEKLSEIYGYLFALLKRSGRIISTMDLLIAASALSDEAPLVTRNLHHFSRVPGLAVLSY